MSFKKNFIRFISDRKQNGKNALQTRSSHLEALEDRQLLDAVGFTSVEQSTFHATFSDQQSNESRYVVLEVRPTDGTRLTKDFTVSIRDASAAEGEGSVQFLSSKIENNTASFLAKYLISNDKTYVFEVGPELENKAYEVRFVMAGDRNGDNVVSYSEYNQFKGWAHIAQGVNASYIERFKILFGIDLRNNVDTLYDLNGNGKLEMSTFRDVIEPNYNDTITLNPTISTNPTISSLKVGGETPTQVDGAENTFTSNKTSSVSGKTDAKTCDFTYTTADGTYSAKDFDLTQPSGQITLTNGDGTTGNTLTFNYTNQDGVFTITPTSGQLPEGTLEMNLDNNFGTSRYRIFIDLTAPKIQATKAYIGDTPNENDVYYTNQADFDLKVNYTLEGGAATLADVLAAESNGLYIHVSENGQEITSKRMTQASDAFVPMTGVTEGAHTYTVKITDLAGNVYGTGTVSVVVNTDFTAPTLTVNGYNVPEGKDHMTVTSQTVTLTPQTETGATVTYTGNLEYTKSQEAYTFTLADGLNMITFTATDQAGNTATETCKVYYEEKLELTQGANVTKYVSTQTGSLNLYDYFNYKSGLTFNETCALQNLESFTKDPENPGTYVYKFKQSALAGSPTESIVVVAQTASGEQSATLHINLCYMAELWTNETVLNELENQNYHIVKTDGITLTGTLVNPAVPGIVNIYFEDGSVPFIANANLSDVYAETGNTKVYDDWRLTFTETTTDGNTNFTLTLNKVNANGETVPLEEGKYTLRARKGADENVEEFVIYRYADPAPSCLKVSIVGENDPTPTFKITRTAAPTDLDRLAGVTVSVYSGANTQPLATKTVTFDENGNINNGDELQIPALEDGKYTFTYKYTNASQKVKTDTETEPYIVDHTAPVITVKQGETTLQNGSSTPLYGTDKLSLVVTLTDITETTVVCKMYNKQDATDQGTVVTDSSDKRLEITDLALAYPDTRLVIKATDEKGNESTWTYEFLCKPDVSNLVENGVYYLDQAVGTTEEKTVDLHDLFIFESDTKTLRFNVVPEGGWSLDENGILSVLWDELTSDMTLTVTATIDNDVLTAREVTVIARKVQDTEPPRWINLTTDGTVRDGKFFLNLLTGKTITGKLYDASGIDTASLAIYQVNGTQPVVTVGNLQQKMDENNQYTLDLATLTDGEGQPLELADGEYEIRFYGKDANANANESTAEGGYQTIPFVIARAPSVVWSAEITPTNGQNSDYVNALEFTLNNEGEISALDDEYGLTVTVTGTKGAKTVDLWNGFYQNGAWVSGEGLRTDTPFSVDPKTAEMEDGQWTFIVKTTNAVQAEASTRVTTVLDTVPPEIKSGLYDPPQELDFNSGMKQIASDTNPADSMSYEAPDWDLPNAIDMELAPKEDDVVKREYSKVLTEFDEIPLVLTEFDEFPLDYGLNILKVHDVDRAGNETTAEYRVVWNSKPKLSDEGVIAQNSGIYMTYKKSGVNIDLTRFFSDEEEAEVAPRYAATNSASSSLSASCTSDGLLTVVTEEIPWRTNPILTGTVTATVTDEYGGNLTQDFTVNLVSQYAVNSIENLKLDGTYPITTNSGGVLTCDLILPDTSNMRLTILDEEGKNCVIDDHGMDSQIDLNNKSGTFNFITKDCKCTFTCTKVTDIQYALEITFPADSLNYGTYSLKMDEHKLGEFVRLQPGLRPSAPVVSQDSIELPLGEHHFEIKRVDANTWSVVFDDGQTIQVTGENVYADTELWACGLDSEDYTLPLYANKLQLAFMNADDPTTDAITTINVVYSLTVSDESLDVSTGNVKAKLLGTWKPGDDKTDDEESGDEEPGNKDPFHKFDDLELASLGGFTNEDIPANHAITKIELNDEKHLVVTYNPYNVEQDRSPIPLTVQTTDGKTIQLNIHMEYEKPFTLIASVTKPEEATLTSKNAPDSLYDVDSPRDYSQTVYNEYDEDDEYQLGLTDFNMQIWFKVDLPIVSQKLYDHYRISNSNLYMALSTTVNVTGGEVKGVIENEGDVEYGIKSRYVLLDAVSRTEDSSFIIPIFVCNEIGLGIPQSCGTDGNYSCLLELVVTPDLEGVSPVFTVSFNDVEGFQYIINPDNSNYSKVNPAQINDGLNGQTIQLKCIKKESQAQSAPQAEPQAAPLAAPALQVETSYAMPQSAVAEMALLEDVDSLDPAVQSSAPVSAPAENASPSLAVETWIQNGDESLGCTTLLASGIVDKDALIDSLASSPAIQQTANALVDSIFEEENA